MITLSKFFTLASGKFFINQSDEAPKGMPYVLETIDGIFRHYFKSGSCSAWSDKNDEAYSYLIQRSIKHGLYKEIPFPSSFSSRNLAVDSFEEPIATKGELTIF